MAGLVMAVPLIMFSLWPDYEPGNISSINISSIMASLAVGCVIDGSNPCTWCIIKALMHSKLDDNDYSYVCSLPCRRIHYEELLQEGIVDFEPHGE